MASTTKWIVASLAAIAMFGTLFYTSYLPPGRAARDLYETGQVDPEAFGPAPEWWPPVNSVSGPDHELTPASVDKFGGNP